MLSGILLLLQMIATVVFGEAAIRKYPEGQQILEKLSKAGLFFLQWRAYADYKKELKQLRNIFAVSALIFTIIFIISGPSKEPSLFNATPGIFIILWATMHFGINIKRSASEQCSMAIILFLAPWIFLLADCANILPPFRLSALDILRCAHSESQNSRTTKSLFY